MKISEFLNEQITKNQLYILYTAQRDGLLSTKEKLLDRLIEQISDWVENYHYFGNHSLGWFYDKYFSKEGWDWNALENKIGDGGEWSNNERVSQMFNSSMNAKELVELVRKMAVETDLNKKMELFDTVLSIRHNQSKWFGDTSYNHIDIIEGGKKTLDAIANDIEKLKED